MKDINDILAKHFSGEATAEEANLVSEWKQKNEEEYAILSESWQAADKALLDDFSFQTYDHQSAWKKIDAKLIDNKKETVIEDTEAKVKIIKMTFYKRVAAACAVLLVGLSAFWFLNRGNYDTLSNTAYTPKEISLPDGSTVWLASNATLEYNSDFKNDRSLRLDGEAFFEVARDEVHPFIIRTTNGNVEVLGTGFNINTTDHKTLVTVSHGKVAVSNEKGSVELTAGQSAEANASGVTSIDTDVNYDAWKTGKFEFEQTPLSEVVEMLNKHYETQVVLEATEKGDERVVGTFDNAPIEEIIESIVLLCDVKSEAGDGIIRLK